MKDMKRLLRTLVVICFLVVLVQVPDLLAAGKPGFNCHEDDTANATLFPEIQAAASRIDQAVCSSLRVPTNKSITDGFPRDEVRAFGALVKKRVALILGHIGIENLDEQLAYFEQTLAQSDVYPVAMPVLIVKKGMGGPRDRTYDYYFTGNFKVAGTLDQAGENKCEQIEALGIPCSKVLAQLAEAILPYQRNANAVIAYDTRMKLKELSNEWDTYFGGARAQTFADIAVTTFLERHHFKKDFLVGPSPRQWFVLHPNVVLEQVDAAPEGEQFKPALSVEWIGLNWWKKSFIGIPFGLSLTSVYSDRPEVDDIGHGVTLHFDNKYTIGYSYRDGDSGFYLSLDLVKLFEDQQQQMERYRSRITKLVQ